MTSMFVHRPVTKRESIYQANGSGRDQYINYFGGGFLRDKILHHEGVYSSGRINRPRMIKKSLPSIEPKYAHYLGDGSGRDQYIIVNEGGMTSQPNLLQSKSPNYIRSLRNYQKFDQPIKENDFLRKSMYALPEKARLVQMNQFFNQQKLINKLSSPKIIISKKRNQSTFFQSENNSQIRNQNSGLRSLNSPRNIQE